MICMLTCHLLPLLEIFICPLLVWLTSLCSYRFKFYKNKKTNQQFKDEDYNVGLASDSSTMDSHDVVAW